MRLINTTTLKLEGPFFGAHLPQYAILSHTWGDEELCLQDMADLSSRENNRARALQDGYDHVWIDTVCIDKTSSAELSEAINSMYEWYAKSTVCYAFLEDFSFQDASLGDAHSDDTSSENSESLRLPSALYFQLSQCRWFTRGWTLQELIAPKRIVFFDKDWIEFGDRSDLTDDISAITGIDVVTLAGFSPRRQSVAYRMSWASRRTTTRPEDLAYCLLGVFGVNMPMLYGEGGERAFIRLQEEILRKSDDTSIFAWSAGTSWSTDVESGYWSLLAPSPSFFEGTFDVSASRQRDGDAVPSISITNRGISLRTRIHVTEPVLSSYHNISAARDSRAKLWRRPFHRGIQGYPHGRQPTLPEPRTRSLMREVLPGGRGGEISRLLRVPRRQAFDGLNTALSFFFSVSIPNIPHVNVHSTFSSGNTCKPG
ncbi:HET-domain-containing protein [Podospora aff. communis PSN243]|uniref:HET-domain-containing protein n=1 Tax=Podospora aff. communis PSN243 TaxID=3040156 RepID=A0AAV9G8F9_9PEZI|nr:HET-domain-containing protein [Podospora aff. communis PSN243]